MMMFACLLLFSGVVSGVNASTFTDEFDDQAYSQNNWHEVFPAWSWSSGYLTGLGDIAHNENETAALLAQNGVSFYNDGLMVETVFRLDEALSQAQIFFSLHWDSELGDWNGYGIDLDTTFSGDGTPALSVQTLHDHGGDQEYADVLLPGLDTSQFYTMRVLVDDTIDVYLYNVDASILVASLLDVPLILSVPYGMVGIGAEPAATFDRFEMTGNPVPVPTAVLLLGSGLVCLTGLRRKFKNK